MEKLLVMKFDKYLIIPKEDFEIIKHGNYFLDDGSLRYYNKVANMLFILNSDLDIVMSISFTRRPIDNKDGYKVDIIKSVLYKDIDPVRDFAGASKEVDLIVIKALKILDEIIEREDKKEDEIHNYFFYDERIGAYDRVTTLHERPKYVQFMPKLEPAFGIIDK